MNHEKNRKLFTLIELLVVIAVIATIAAILLPALNTARQKAHTISCVNNMKQWGVMIIGYQDAFDDYIMPFNQCRIDLSGFREWLTSQSYISNQVQKYNGSDSLNTPAIMHCPAVPAEVKRYYDPNETTQLRQVSYIINQGVSYSLKNLGIPGNPDAKKVHIFKIPSKTPQMVDGIGSASYSPVDLYVNPLNPPGTSSARRIDYRHSRTCNILTLGGNVETGVARIPAAVSGSVIEAQAVLQ